MWQLHLTILKLAAADCPCVSSENWQSPWPEQSHMFTVMSADGATAALASTAPKLEINQR